MLPLKDTSKALEVLERSYGAQEQLRAREVLKDEVDLYPYRILSSYLKNPFLKLTESDVAALQGLAPSSPMSHFIAARDAATRFKTPKFAVFCMPKSGSSFVQSALQHALQFPFVSLTSVGTPVASSHFGMNSREQELDELAIIKSTLQARSGFVAQHHTRYSVYLALQLQLYGISPIVTVRNVLDSIVSFDDMIRPWRQGGGPNRWMSDAQFALPLDYEDLDDEARYTILTHSLGIWLINFYLSWKRCRRQQYTSPHVIRYEDHVLDQEKLIALLSGHVPMSEPQLQRLRDYVYAPDEESSRYNVGRRGRGEEKLPERLKSFVGDYARMFRSELDDDDIRYLVR